MSIEALQEGTCLTSHDTIEDRDSEFISFRKLDVSPPISQAGTPATPDKRGEHGGSSRASARTETQPIALPFPMQADTATQRLGCVSA
ncbi:MAG: hypothetical protein DDG59_04315 [Anaerolineae bacterium]|nr:MAG: hypothetical protein DDG59_04315 [Anaerolineae bacterium]